MLGPFIDTILVCSITALIILVTGVHNFGHAEGELTAIAFETGLNSAIGGKLVALGIIFFAFSTAISWSYYGDRASDYLFGKKAVKPYRWFYLAFLVLGAVVQFDIVIGFSDIMNALMALPNLVAIIVLSPIVVKLSKDYFERMRNQKMLK